MKSGSLNLLETPGPVKACNGIALPLPIPIHNFIALTKAIVQEYKANYPTINQYISNLFKQNF
jgi:hypothetical protein